MPLYRPSELKQFLKELNASPNKRLSQNFLIDGNIIEKIVATAQVQPQDHILEIGPGPGALTERLVNEKARVIAIEKDVLFAKALARFSNVIVHCSDIRDFPLDSLGKEKFKVVANLPYHLTSPILGLLLPRYDLFSELTIMVQEEVAQRIVATEGVKDYSSLSIFTNVYSKASYSFFVSKNCFYPRPKVNSAVVHFILKPPPEKNIQPFLDFVHFLFCHRRKMIRSVLSSQYSKDQLEKAFDFLLLGENERSENLSTGQLLRLFKYLENIN